MLNGQKSLPESQSKLNLINHSLRLSSLMEFYRVLNMKTCLLFVSNVDESDMSRASAHHWLLCRLELQSL
ncbi:hypothetical protein LINPERHAP1_LOCUS15423 [Linum perenne]